MKTKDVLNKAYGNIPNEVSPAFDFDIEFVRSIKYYYLKLIRYFIR